MIDCQGTGGLTVWQLPVVSRMGLHRKTSCSVTREFHKVRLKGQPEPVLSGPDALYTCKRAGKTVGRRH